MSSTTTEGGYKEFPADQYGGATGVLTGSANEITVEASLGKMWDEGRKAGYKDGLIEGNRMSLKREKQLRDEAVAEYKRARKARKRERRQLGRYEEGGY